MNQNQPARTHRHLATIAALTCCLGLLSAGDAAPGTTEVLRWKDGKKAALILMFDDNLKSQQEVAVPELEKRGFKAVFYVNPNKLGFLKNPFWTTTLPSLGHEYGVHTMNHRGDATTAAADLAECLRVLRPLQPTVPPTALWSFARPGGKGAWEVPRDVESEILAKAGLISRDHGAFLMYVGQDRAALEKWLAAQIKAGTSAKICFHGVGGDYIGVTKDVYVWLLDHLVAKQADLWIAPHMPVHQYETQTTTAKVQTTRATNDLIDLTLTCDADPALYTHPLTLRTTIAWKTCVAEQDGKPLATTLGEGVVQYDARPGVGSIRLRPAGGK